MKVTAEEFIDEFIHDEITDRILKLHLSSHGIKYQSNFNTTVTVPDWKLQFVFRHRRFGTFKVDRIEPYDPYLNRKTTDDEI